MRGVGPVSEAEVVATFLRAELESPRYREPLVALLERDRRKVAVVVRPNLEDAEENAYREMLLDGYRGWLRREGLFDGFPEGVEWSRVLLTREEVLSILYIDWDWWLTISAGTRRPVDAAERIRRGLVPGVSAEGHEPIAARFAGNDPPPELIVATNAARTKLVLVEGHVRLTAYALFPHYLPDELEVLLGSSEEIDRWSEF